MKILKSANNSSGFTVVGYILAGVVAFSMIVLVLESIRNKRKNGWVTIESKKNVIPVDYELLNDVKDTPLITDL